MNETILRVQFEGHSKVYDIARVWLYYSDYFKKLYEMYENQPEKLNEVHVLGDPNKNGYDTHPDLLMSWLVHLMKVMADHRESPDFGKEDWTEPRLLYLFLNYFVPPEKLYVYKERGQKKIRDGEEDLAHEREDYAMEIQAPGNDVPLLPEELHVYMNERPKWMPPFKTEDGLPRSGRCYDDRYLLPLGNMVDYLEMSDLRDKLVLHMGKQLAKRLKSIEDAHAYFGCPKEKVTQESIKETYEEMPWLDPNVKASDYE